MSKKLAYIIYSLSNSAGMERALTSRANFLCDTFDITIITEGQDELKDFYPLDGRIRRIDLNIRKSGTNREIKSDCYKKLSDVLLQERFDIVSSLGGMETFFLYRILDGSKKIVEFRFSFDYFKALCQENGKSWKRWVSAEFETARRIYYARKYDGIVVLTKKDEQKWRRWTNKVFQIYNAMTIDLGDVSPCTAHQVIAVGRLEYAKGFDMLIKAWNKIKNDCPDWTLKIFGEGSQRTNLEDLLRTYHLENNVFMPGISSNIKNEYLQSSLFVLSSREEGFGLVLTEAEACGLPIVTFACPNGPAEIVDHNINGFVIQENGSVDELANAIKILIEDEETRKQMGHMSLKVVQKFSIPRIKEQWVNLFNGLNERTSKK